MASIYADEGMKASLMINGRLPQDQFLPPEGIELRPVCLPGGTGGSNCTATRQDWFLTNVANHNVSRISYQQNQQTNFGAWTLSTLPIAAEDAQRYVDTQPELIDGTAAPRPTHCVVNSSRPPENAQTRLYLQVPPHYPDEVRARQWAQGRGFAIAPPTICTRASLQAVPASPPADEDGE